MKKVIIAVSLLVIGATGATAQPFDGRGEWRRGDHPYARPQHGSCQAAARRLANYERRAYRDDGRLVLSERRVMADLRRDLDRRCGGYRWR
jgi:hypothetical protein